MREIKFRGKRKDNGEWVYGIPLKYGNNLVIVGDFIECNSEYTFIEFWEPVDPATVSQFTGLYDKNGTEIYEGDILHERSIDEFEESGYSDLYYEVIFKDSAFGFLGEITGEFYSFSEFSINGEAVAGNIHDNPGLIDDDTREQDYM